MDIQVSEEIKNFCYRHVLWIIREKGCDYDTAWTAFRKALEERMRSKAEPVCEDFFEIMIREVDNQQQYSNQQKMGDHRNEYQRVCENNRAQRKVRTGVPAESGAG